jgi:hypothetical protein
LAFAINYIIFNYSPITIINLLLVSLDVAVLNLLVVGVAVELVSMLVVEDVVLYSLLNLVDFPAVVL